MGLLGATPVAPPLTEKNLPDQTGKASISLSDANTPAHLFHYQVFIVTGSSGGIGAELAQILYAKNAKVYVAARSADKASKAIAAIKEKTPRSKGQLTYLHLDLSDLSGIKASVAEFLAKEKKLHVLWNNAGVMVPPQGTTTKQGYELQLGTNNVGPFLFTKLLTPVMVETAKTEPAGSVRVAWVSSLAAKSYAPKGGIDMSNLDYKIKKDAFTKYGASKAGNILHGTEYAKRHGKDGILSISVDPGVLKTNLYNNMPRWQYMVVSFLLHPPIFGAYTELFAGLSPQLTTIDNGAFVEPWGKVASMRKDVEASTRTTADGGTGVAERFWEWSEEQVARYV